jgi:ribosome-binding ATPase YchF (GTP1/OBG family)
VEEDIREHSSSDVDVPARKEVLLENLDCLTGSEQVLEENVEEVIDLVVQWQEDQLEKIRSRVRELAKPVVQGGEGSAEGV